MVPFGDHPLQLERYRENVNWTEAEVILGMFEHATICENEVLYARPKSQLFICTPLPTPKIGGVQAD